MKLHLGDAVNIDIKPTPVSRIETLYISRENLMDSIIDPDFPNSTLSILQTKYMAVIGVYNYKEYSHI